MVTTLHEDQTAPSTDEWFAVYWVPRTHTAIGQFGIDWTGWCADSARYAKSPFQRELATLRGNLAGSLTMHGLHGLIREPFAGSGQPWEWVLDGPLQSLAESTAAIRLPRLVPALIDGAVSLVPEGKHDSLNQMVARVADAVLNAHAPAPDTTRQTGTPIALPRLQPFRIPLTTRLDPQLAQHVIDMLNDPLAPMLNEQPLLSDIALMTSAGPGSRWRVLQRYRLRQSPIRPRSGLDGFDPGWDDEPDLTELPARCPDLLPHGMAVVG